MSEPQKNIIESALAAGRQMAPEMQYENGTPFLIVSKDEIVKEFPHLRDSPIRTDQTVKHTTAESFIDYFNKFASAESVIFIDEVHNKFTAIFDYHAPLEAGWKAHKSIFELMKTPEWAAWEGSNSKPMNQTDFAQFIENNLTEIINPAGAKMLEIALTISAKTDVAFSSSIRLDNGQNQLTYNEVIDGSAGAKGQIKIPEKFTLGLKLFRGGAPYQMDARLRYRIREGRLTMWYELIRPHAVIDANIADTRQLIADKTSKDVIFSAVEPH
ncbi:MAG: DUF2303 family protein [Methylosarcina sp.]